MELEVTKRDMLGFFLLMTVIVLEVNISLQQHCPSAFTSQHGSALVGSEYKSFTSKDYTTCMMKCDVDDRCMSVNFLLATKTCDLNTQTKDSRPACFQTRANSVYTTNMAFRTPKFAKSCREILATCKLQESGEYWIDPEQRGKPIRVLCDMTTDGGGWTVVKRTILEGSQVPRNKRFNTYKVLTAYNMNQADVIPRAIAMLNIRLLMGFDQIHFYCHKKLVGRVVSIMTRNDTAGQQVVRYFTDDEYASSNFPDACGSFDRLPDDTSYLSANCQRWGKDELGNTEVNKWGYYDKGSSSGRISTKPFGVHSDPKYNYGILNSTNLNWCLCDDDSKTTPEPCSANDTWLIAVR